MNHIDCLTKIKFPRFYKIFFKKLNLFYIKIVIVMKNFKFGSDEITTEFKREERINFGRNLEGEKRGFGLILRLFHRL